MIILFLSTARSTTNSHTLSLHDALPICQRHQCDGRGQGNQAGQPQQGPGHAGAAGARFLVPILDATVRGTPRLVVVVAELVVVSHTSPPRRGCADATGWRSARSGPARRTR